MIASSESSHVESRPRLPSVTSAPTGHQMSAVPTPAEHLSGAGNSWSGAKPPTCCRCGSEIYDRLMVRVEAKLMHSACVRCTSCGVEVTDVCFSDGNDVYCQTDFYRRFGGQCSGCSGMISPTESVRMAGHNIYHEACFACALCHEGLQTGDKFYVREDNKLLCDQDLHKLTTNGSGPTYGHAERSDINLTPEQRKIMEHAYQTNPRPSRHIRQKLSTLTGIETRLIHLWFRNKRSKTRSRRARNIRRGTGSQDSETNDSDAETSGCLSGSGDDSHNSSNEVAYPMNYTSDLSTIRRSPISKSSHSRLENWLKHIDSLAVDAVPPNMELKASDFTANGEIRLSAADGIHSGPWYQAPGNQDTWIPVI